MKATRRNNWRGRYWRVWLDGIEMHDAISFETADGDGWVRVPLRDENGRILWWPDWCCWLMRWLTGVECKTEVLHGLVHARDQGKR